MDAIQDDLKELQRVTKLVAVARDTLQRLRDRAGLHSATLDGMPRSSGPKDRVGEAATNIVAAEGQLKQLEDEYWKVWLRVSDWVDGIEDLQVQLILSLRYLDGKRWDEVAKEAGMDEGAVRMTVNRYLKRCGQ